MRCRARTRRPRWRSSARSSSCSGGARTTFHRHRSTTPIEFANFDDPKYAGMPTEARPQTECLKDVLERALPYWYDQIVPDLRAGKVTLIAAHGNSLRAIVKHLDQMGDEAVVGLNIPTGIPLLYDLDDDLKPIEIRRPLPRPGGRCRLHRGRQDAGQEVSGLLIAYCA